MVKHLKYMFWLLLPMLVSCSANKFLPEGEKYLDDVKIDLSGDLSRKTKRNLQYALESAMQPEPVYKLWIGSRPEVWFYHQTYGDSSGISKWIYRKLAQKPVYLSDVNNQQNLENTRYIMENEGYFYPEIQSRIDTHKNGVNIHYDIISGKPLIIDSIKFDVNAGELQRIINRQQQFTLLKKGNRLQLGRLEEERNRITDSLSEMGYFYFRPDFLIFEIDTIQGERKANVFLELKENLLPETIQRYKTGKVEVYSNYRLKDTLQIDSMTRVEEQEFVFIYPKKYVKNKTLANQIAYEPGRYISRQDQQSTLEKISNLNVYKFINAIPEQENDSTINIAVYLTPEVQNNIKLEANLVTKSNNFTGPGISISHLNRNAFKGAEKLEVSFHTSFETQIGGQNSGVNTLEIGASNNLSIPGIKLPFAKAWSKSVTNPYSNVAIAYNFQSRVNQFTLTSTNLAYEVDWKGLKGFSHKFSVLDITFLKTSNISDAFQMEIDNNPILAESFRETFIPEVGYEFTWSPNRGGRKPYYINLDLLFAGNASNAVAGLFQKNAETYDLFGVPISQYARIFLEGRHYWYDRSSQMVVRFIGGFGLAYGNSNTLPYQRQFFAGGANSI
ncbi:MAG: hypothetical protein KDC24_07725, partial [Saprospiraceae bacterium]|nr:hypothetical protein [Saprospiraceae bacterium]